MARRALRAVLALLTFSGVAHAAPGDVIALPATLPEKAPSDPTLEALLPRIDSLVSEAVQDLGLRLELTPRTTRERPTDDELVQQARDSWVVLPSVEREGRRLRLRIVAVRPGSQVILTRSELSSRDDLDVRVAVMMRDLVQLQASGPRPAPPPSAAELAEQREPRSSGRAVLALNAAVFGGFVGYSIQAASGSTDDRVLYPLVALGTGVGLGASMLVADEWDVSVGNAWFLSAGLWWPTSAGMLIAASHNVSKNDRYVYGVVTGTGGVALSVAAMSLTHINEGDAAIAHTGGAFGMSLGGLTELFGRGLTSKTPIRGMGYGAAIGTLGGGILATQIDVKSSRVLMVDLGATLGALTGAAAGSPLLLVDPEKENKSRNRLWLGSIFVGSVVGGGIGWWSTRKSEPAPTSASVASRSAFSSFSALPYANATPTDLGTHFEAGLVGRF